MQETDSVLQNGYIIEDKLKYKFANIYNFVQEAKLQLFVDFLKINKNNFEELFNKIQESNQNYVYLTTFLEYLLKIRPKQTENICLILSKISKLNKYTPSKDLCEEIRETLIKNGVIKESSTNKSYFTHLKDLNIYESIKNDDINNFINLTAEHDFDPKRKLLINRDRTIYFVNNGNDVSYMQIIAYYGSVKCFKFALMDGTFDEKNLAKYAIAGGNIEIIHLLEQKGVRFDDCFEVAAKFNQNEISEWLLRNYKCESFDLWKSVEYFNMTSFFFLLNNNICLSIDKAFFSSIKTNNLLLTKYLIDEFHINIEEKNEYERTALRIASYNNNLELVKYLIEDCHANIFDDDFLRASKDIKGYFQSRCLLHELSKIGDFVAVKKLIEEENYFVDQKYNGSTALHNACENGSIALVKYLVNECKANVEMKDRKERIPLHIACENGNLELVKFLVEECHSNIEEKDYWERTALLVACEHENIDLVKYLVEECHANVEEKDDIKRTALYIASEKNNIDLLKYLVEECKANVDTISKSALHIACENNNLDLVKYLVEKCKVNVEEKRKERDLMGNISNRRSALHIACEEGNFNLIKYLVEECHANVESKDRKGKTVLHVACEKCNIKLVKYLFEKCKADIEAKTEEKAGWKTINRRSALHIASEKSNFELVKYLIEECHANIETISNKALSIAKKKGNNDLVNYLVEKCHMNAAE